MCCGCGTGRAAITWTARYYKVMEVPAPTKSKSKTIMMNRLDEHFATMSGDNYTTSRWNDALHRYAFDILILVVLDVTN